LRSGRSPALFRTLGASESGGFAACEDLSAPAVPLDILRILLCVGFSDNTITASHRTPSIGVHEKVPLAFQLDAARSFGQLATLRETAGCIEVSCVPSCRSTTDASPDWAGGLFAAGLPSELQHLVQDEVSSPLLPQPTPKRLQPLQKLVLPTKKFLQHVLEHSDGLSAQEMANAILFRKISATISTSDLVGRPPSSAAASEPRTLTPARARLKSSAVSSSMAREADLATCVPVEGEDLVWIYVWRVALLRALARVPSLGEVEFDTLVDELESIESAPCVRESEALNARLLSSLVDKCGDATLSPSALLGTKGRPQDRTIVLDTAKYGIVDPSVLGITPGTKGFALLKEIYADPQRRQAMLSPVTHVQAEIRPSTPALTSTLCQFRTVTGHGATRTGGASRVQVFDDTGGRFVWDELADPLVAGPLASDKRVDIATNVTFVGADLSAAFLQGRTPLWPDEAATAMALVLFGRGRPMAARAPASLIRTIGFASAPGLPVMTLSVAWSRCALDTINHIRGLLAKAIAHLWAVVSDTGSIPEPTLVVGAPLLRVISTAIVLSSVTRAAEEMDGGLAVSKFETMWTHLRLSRGEFSEAQRVKMCRDSLRMLRDVGRDRLGRVPLPVTPAKGIWRAFGTYHGHSTEAPELEMFFEGINPAEWTGGFQELRLEGL
jgi:hypothetical protein